MISNMDFIECIGCLVTSKLLWLIFATIVSFYYYLTLNNDHFEKRGIKHLKPMSLYGMLQFYFSKPINFIYAINDVYLSFPNEKLIGVFEFRQPVFYLRDPELIKLITIKHFDHFVNHRTKIDENIEPLFGRSLFSMRDQRWKDMRSTLSPAFTGSKMRNMFSLVADCSNETIKYLLKEANGKPLEIEMKDLFTRFTNDVIATCSFGIEINSLKNRNNEFFEMGKVVTNFDGLQGFKFIGFNSFPNIMKFFRISLFDKKTVNFFRTLVHGTMAYREKENIIRPDMINLLMQAKQGKLTNSDNQIKDDNVGFATVEESEIGKSTTGKIKKWDDDDLTAQSLIFFLAGFDTVSVLMCFMAHELAVNPDIQDRLYDEVKEVKEELNGKPLTYEILQKMKYLDMIVSETLRKWPPGILSDRYCNKGLILDVGNGTKVKFLPGDAFSIPTFSIHRDPKHYPDPEKFDPERFSDENKDLINPAAYFPFGLGPRNCIGSRFALMESKAIIFYILSNFRIEKSPQTQHPINLQSGAFTLKAEKGFWVNLQPL